MPVKLSTTIDKIQSLSNSVNSKLISELCEYMKKNGLSESHINNTLKTNMLFSEFLGCFLLRCKEQRTDNKFLGFKNEEFRARPR
jgi:hypothetical protein